MSDSKFEFDVIIVGAGVIGCAIAEKISQRNLNVCVFEKGPRIAEGVTSRNSGVIHAGIYYPPNSLKAKFCVRGNQLLYNWCKKKNVAHAKIGKLIVQSHEKNSDELEAIHQNALASGVTSLQPLTSKQVKTLEPELNVVAALYSPETGIVDPYELSRSLLNQAEQHGCLHFLKHEVINIQKNNDRLITWGIGIIGFLAASVIYLISHYVLK